jgi:hypothetical protein
MVAWTNAPRAPAFAMLQPDWAGVIPPVPVSWYGVARPCAVSGLAGTMMSQFTLAAAAGGVADAEGVGVVQVALGLAEADAVVVGETVDVVVGVTVGVVVGVTVGVVVGVTVGVTVATVDGVTVGAAVEVAEVVGAGVVLGGGEWWRRRQRDCWAAVTAALVVADAVGAAEPAGTVEEDVAGVVVPGVADDDTQAAPLAASLVVASFAPEFDEKSNPATTPSTATTVPTIAPRRARGRSSNTW